MKLLNFLCHPESKYALIRLSSYQLDPVAQALTSSPSHLTVDGVELVVLSLEPAAIAELVVYLESIGSGVEFQLTFNSGLVTLLLHSEVIKLKEKYDAAEV